VRRKGVGRAGNGSRTFVGFGFGPIQSGLFLYEAFRSGNFGRLVVAEVVPGVVADLRRNQGAYVVNVADAAGIRRERVEGVEVLNPSAAEDREALVAAVAEAEEIATALPSVEVFDQGPASAAGVLAEAFARTPPGPPCAVYAGENHNHAAEILAAHVARRGGTSAGRPVQFLNTVIGKMSGVVRDPAEIAALGLERMTPHSDRAVLVEAFNRILVTRVDLPGFRRGIEVFEEKPDLLPYEEAKLYGHNAVHALIGYLARRRGLAVMSDAARDTELMKLAREAFVEESGRALIARHEGVDPLFTPEGYAAYADDLLRRMGNPWLNDRVERVVRDPRRKLGWSDRLAGTMRLALDAGVRPARFALGAGAALECLLDERPGVAPAALLDELWADAPDLPPGRKACLKALILRDRQGP
jgi:mannitol-1-phosphate 5-dehydrogenase